MVANSPSPKWRHAGIGVRDRLRSRRGPPSWGPGTARPKPVPAYLYLSYWRLFDVQLQRSSDSQDRGIRATRLAIIAE